MEDILRKPIKSKVKNYKSNVSVSPRNGPATEAHVVPLQYINWLCALLTLFFNSAEHQIDVFLQNGFLLPHGLLRKPMSEKLANVAMIVPVGIENDGFAIQSGKVLLVLGELKLSRLMTVYFLPLRSVDV